MPARNTRNRVRRVCNNETVYDVTYSIDEDGLRRSFAAATEPCDAAVLFFGCSMTFGEGLEDEETIPYLAGKISNRKTYNFGFHGYGPHQMLSAIEHGVVDGAVRCRPRYAIFQTEFSHVSRAAGKKWWGSHGPHYVLSPAGASVHDGRFDDHKCRMILRRLFQKSAVYQRFFRECDPACEKDLKTYLAIILSAKEALQDKFPGLEFHVVYWGARDSHNKKHVERDEDLLERFQRAGITVHQIKDILPGYQQDPGQYAISRYDSHPNFKANQYIADYIVQHIF